MDVLWPHLLLIAAHLFFCAAAMRFRALALIVRGADTDARRLTPESAGLYATATGFQAIAKDDHDNMAKQFPAYDALYAYCQARVRSS